MRDGTGLGEASELLRRSAAVAADGAVLRAQPGHWRPGARAQDLAGLGPLQAAVMRVVWDRGRVTVRDIYEALGKQRRTAYTTVMTTLSALASKGLVSQDRSGRAHVYVATMTDTEVATAILDVVVDVLLGGNAGALLEHLQRQGAAASSLRLPPELPPDLTPREEL